MNQLLRKICAVLTVGALCAPGASAEIAVIVNPKNPATRMFSEQAAQFFVGKSALFKPIEQADGSPVREEFYRKVLGKDADQMKAIWSKIVFTGQGLAPKQFSSSASVKKAVAADLNAIGYIEKSDLDDSVKAVLMVP